MKGTVIWCHCCLNNSLWYHLINPSHLTQCDAVYNRVFVHCTRNKRRAKTRRSNINCIVSDYQDSLFSTIFLVGILFFASDSTNFFAVLSLAYIFFIELNYQDFVFLRLASAREFESTLNLYVCLLFVGLAFSLFLTLSLSSRSLNFHFRLDEIFHFHHTNIITKNWKNKLYGIFLSAP